MADVFISYARRTSSSHARALQEILARDGVSVFLDEREIPFGAAFPNELTRGLLDASVAVVFTDEAYFERPWCVHELRLLTAAYRAGDTSALPTVVIALPVSGDLATVTAHLPPQWAAASWPAASQTDALADAVRNALGGAGRPLRAVLSESNDDTLERMRAGADQPLAWADTPAKPSVTLPPLWSVSDAPSPRGEGFIGRSTELWHLAHECVSARAFTPARTVVVRGLGGSGKSLLASEFVARYARRFFPAGVVWINCEQGAEGLLASYVALWPDIAPGVPLPTHDTTQPTHALATLARTVGDRLRSGTTAGRLLWVIDGLPEPGRPGTNGPSGLDAWCPALHHVTVLATTRRADSLRDAQATLTVGPLPQSAAIALLTRPPVDEQWMTTEEWKAVAHWTGELPLVLSLLRESLIDGGLSIETLRSAPKAEPAAASEQLMEALRGEVDDRSLRGAAEAFEVSWRALASDGALEAAASRLALLAPVPLAESLLHTMASEAHIGKLVRRGWLQPASGGGTRRTFTLHRVPASVLRLKLTNPSAAFTGVFDGLTRTVENGADVRDRLHVHLHVVMSHLGRMQIVALPELVEAARRFTQAVARLGDREHRGLRYLAARTAQAFGDEEAFVAALVDATDDTEEAQAAIPHVLQPLKDSPTARQWIARLLVDTRDAVRWQALVHASSLASHDLLLPLLQAILREARVDYTANFDPYLQPPYLRDSLSHLANALATGDTTARRRAASLLGRAFAIHGRELKAGGFNAQWLVRHLVRVALTDNDEDVRSEAASAAGYFFDLAAWVRLRDAVDSGDDTATARALAALDHYLGAATAPRTPKSAQVEFDHEGGMRLTAAFGDAAELLPASVIDTLIAWTVHGPESVARSAGATLASLRQGLAASAPWVHERLDNGEFALVDRLADALVHAKPDFVNGWWWRAQAREGLGNDEGACTDFEEVARLAPQFTDARVRWGDALLRLGKSHYARDDYERAASLMLRASELLADRFDAHHFAASALINAQRHDEADTAASRAIAVSDTEAEAWFFRAIARSSAGRLQDAWDDIQRAAVLDPADERITSFRNEIEHRLRPGP